MHAIANGGSMASSCRSNRVDRIAGLHSNCFKNEGLSNG